MGDLIKNWLNNEIELSQPVQDFEKDFANGYLLGELLYKFNQQSNFKEFSKKESVAAKIDNFNKLQPTLKNLKIKFDSKIIDQVMKENRGVALCLLYQMKMALEKVYPPTDIAVLRKTGKMGDNQPALKIAHSKEKYDLQAQTFFQQRLQVLNRPQKALNMETHLKKFEEEKGRQEVIASKANMEEIDAKDKVRQEIRKAQINKLQRNAGFMEEWLQKGVEDWKKNQSTKKDRERRQLEFEYKQTEKYHNFAVTKIDDSTKEVMDGINQFEKTLRGLGIETKVKKDEADRAVSESLQNSPLKSSQRGQRFQSMTNKQSFGQSMPFGGTLPTSNKQLASGAFTLSNTGLKTKDKKTVTEKTRKERERRRRKMIVDQAKTHIEMEQKRRELQIVDRMKRQAKQEEELSYEQWRTNQCKNVIIENRKLREARYERRKELDQQTSNWREEEMLRQMKDQMQRELDTLRNRDFEMRVVGKQAHRERRNEFGYALFDAIFDIADEAYNHQQKCDSQEIDQRNWHEWLQLFIEEMPIQGTLEKLNQPVTETNQPIDEEAQEELQEDIDNGFVDEIDPNQKLDQMELEDYLRNQGQWTTNIILDNPPNLEQFLTGQTDAQPVAGAKGAKAAPAKQAVEQIQLEEGDTELPQQAPNNYILGDAVEQIINLNYEGRQKHQRPNMPQYLNLKLCFVGYAFAGKKTQAKKLIEQYGLNVYYLNDLVDQALRFYESNPQPIYNYNQQNQQYYEEAVSEDSEQEQEINPEEDFRASGEEISNVLKEGQEISDQIYVNLFVAKVRMTYSHKSKKQLRFELRQKVEKERELAKKIGAAEIELQEAYNNDENDGGQRKRRHHKDPEQSQQKLDKLRQEYSQLQSIEKNGWILVDFPSTFAQAKLLETALSGYVPHKECDPIDREQQIEDAFLLVQPTAKEEPPRILMKSGLDAVVWFDLSRDECMRRALGRRYDSVNEKIYHIEDAQPLTTSNLILIFFYNFQIDAPLCERLVPMDEEDNAEATLIDRWISFDQSSKGLEKWLLDFGDAETEESILFRINSEVNQDVLLNSINEIIQKVVESKKRKEDLIRQRINDKLDQQEQEEIERRRKEQEEEEERRRREEEGIPEQELPKKEDKIQKPEPATERIPLKEANVTNIDNDFKPTVVQVWTELCKNYKLQMKKVFKQIRGQRERITEQFSDIQNKYLDFLQRPDTKQEKLEQFIRDFNNFSDQYPDLREDDQTKEELHQRVDILTDELWEIIEERKEQHIEEKKKIMESGWVEYEQAYLVSSAQQIMQSEVDKFKSTIQILHDYYHTFEDKLIPEAPLMITTELVAENEELPPVESLPDGSDALNPNLYHYPRLDKIFERALKSQVVPDVTQIQTGAQDKKAVPQKGKDPKKQVEEEKPLEESQYVREMKAAIKIEKSILRYRLSQVRNWTLKRLKDMRSKAIKVYTKLEDWIHVSNKTENDAVEEMSIVVKIAIEEEKKIQDELRIKFMDFCVDEKIMNYIEPPPEKLPAMEEIQSDRFSIRQLNALIDEFIEIGKQHGNGTPFVPTKLLVDLFVRKLENSKTLGDEGSLPDDWKSFTEYDFWNMIRNLDKYNNGVINWKQLASFILLLKSPLPTDKNIEDYKQSLEFLSGKNGDKISGELFTKASAWYDEAESSKDRDYSHNYPRAYYIKELFVKANSDPIIISRTLNALKAKEMTMFRRNIKCYGDILFKET